MFSLLIKRLPMYYNSNVLTISIYQCLYRNTFQSSFLSRTYTSHLVMFASRWQLTLLAFSSSANV